LSITAVSPALHRRTAHELLEQADLGGQLRLLLGLDPHGGGRVDAAAQQAHAEQRLPQQRAAEPADDRVGGAGAVGDADHQRSSST
jgi:hypothetical protein